MNPTEILAGLALLVFLGLLLEEFFRRTGIPDVLVLLGLGIAGAAFGLVDVRSLSGVASVFTTAALVLILFEGATQMRLGELRTSLGGATLISVLGFFSTVAVVGAIGTVLFGMRPLAALLLGSIVGGTSSAVVIPMVQTVRLAPRTRTVLTLESALTDVFCIVFALALVGALTSAAGGVSFGAMGTQLGIGFVGALAIGAICGLAWAFGLRALRQRRASLVALAAAVFLVYAGAEAAGTFGAIACLAFGVVLGNAPSFARRTEGLELAQGERLFLSEVAFLLKVFFFVYLGASLDLGGFRPWLFGLLVTAGIYAIRPAVVRLSLPPSVTPRRDATVASALVPKGLAAAVLASVPVQAGIAEGHAIEAATVGAILMSITLSSGLVFAVDRPAVRRIYERFFRKYPEELAAPELAAPEIVGSGAVVALAVADAALAPVADATPAADAPAEAAPENTEREAG